MFLQTTGQVQAQKPPGSNLCFVLKYMFFFATTSRKCPEMSRVFLPTHSDTVQSQRILTESAESLRITHSWAHLALATHMKVNDLQVALRSL